MYQSWLPVFIVFVDEERHLRVGLDVPDPGQLLVLDTFGFGINCRIENTSVKDVTNGNGVRSGFLIHRGQAGHPGLF